LKAFRKLSFAPCPRFRFGAFRRTTFALARIGTRRGAFIPAMTPPDTTEQLVSVETSAARLDVSRRSLYRLIARRELPQPLQVGRCSKLCASDLAAYIQRIQHKAWP
jgi:predicted DNA-binding transcriptional regulator AlpA